MNNQDFSDLFFKKMFKYMDKDFDQLVKCGMRITAKTGAGATRAKTPSPIDRAYYVANYAFSVCFKLYATCDVPVSHASDVALRLARYKLWLAGYGNNDISRALMMACAYMAEKLNRERAEIVGLIVDQYNERAR